jgi:sugar lactone lactonase YvrE
MRRATIAVLTFLVLFSVGAGGVTHVPRPVGDTKVWVKVPDPPGNPEGITVRRNVVFVGTHAPVSGDADEGPSKIFRYKLRTGKKAAPPIKIRGQNSDDTHGILWMASDKAGRLYVLDRDPPRLLRLTKAFSRRPRQRTYATFPDLAPCHSSDHPCSQTNIDLAPFPDYIAFDRSGNGYVTDLEQGTIFRVPPGGGKAKVWFTDPRLDSVFGPNGIAIDPTGKKLYFAMTGSVQPTSPTQGVIYTLPLKKKPQPNDLKDFFVYPEPASGPDGIAFGRSGKLYVVLAGANQISILNRDGTEELRFPSAPENQQQEVPYDSPASIAFNRRGSLLVTNQSFFADDSDHMVVFDAWVDDIELPVIEPRF